MATADIDVTAGWVKIADTGVDFTASFSAAVKYAVQASDTAPTATVGHTVPRGSDGFALTREIARDGYVFAKAAPPNNAAVATVTT